jgi:hypothetical protein
MTVTVRNNENTFAKLRDAEVRCIDLKKLRCVRRATKTVDSLQAPN